MDRTDVRNLPSSVLPIWFHDAIKCPYFRIAPWSTFMIWSWQGKLVSFYSPVLWTVVLLVILHNFIFSVQWFCRNTRPKKIFLLYTFLKSQTLWTTMLRHCKHWHLDTRVRGFYHSKVDLFHDKCNLWSRKSAFSTSWRMLTFLGHFHNMMK